MYERHQGRGLVDEAIEVGRCRSEPIVTHTGMLPLELPNVKTDLELELEDSRSCSKSRLDLHWLSELGIAPGHSAHRESAPHEVVGVALDSASTPPSSCPRSV
jgi:hypothetical protein